MSAEDTRRKTYALLVEVEHLYIKKTNQQVVDHGPAVQRVDNVIQPIDCYSAEKCQDNVLCYPPNRDLSSG